MSSVILYTKPACPQCSATKRALEKLGVEYSLIDVTKDDDAYALVAGLDIDRLQLLSQVKCIGLVSGLT